ncbi:MAG: preprotein translocase subunit SecA [Bacteroidetes bacterium]|nr:MAG: preprotein translocase subunit SecA [Bacteroidota bacterium]
MSKNLTKVFGNKSDKDIKEITPIVEEINTVYGELNSLTNDELRAKTVQLKEQISEHLKEIDNTVEGHQKELDENAELDIDQRESIYDSIDKLKKDRDEQLEVVLDEILPTAFAVVKETARRFQESDSIEVTASDFDRDLAARRDSIEIKGDKAIWSSTWLAADIPTTWNMLHYDVQLVGGMILHKGKIAEMATGEGKTLAATLPAYLNALSGHGVHIVTVNDYLARRDSEWMGPLFEFHGLKVDCIDKHQPHSETRINAYLSDIVYGTNNEYGFDYLRDNMCRFPEELVQRKLHFAIIDEVDSVLIDEARTPLIISGPTPRGDQHEFHELKPRIEKLVGAQKKYMNTVLLDAKKQIQEGNDKYSEGGLSLLRAFRGLPKNKALIKFLSESGTKATLLKSENYYMQDNSKEMHIVDDELFFVIDEKNNSIELTDKGIDLITDAGEDPSFFIMPDVGGEIAEIEKSEMSDKEKLTTKDELLRDFGVKSERLHSIQQLLKAYTLFEKDIDYILAENKVKIVDEQTGRVMDGRRYSDGLHQAIEAKENVKVEAATQTYATVTLQNFFRMYHKLSGMTGTAETEAGELWDIYKLDVTSIPSNVPLTRDDREDLVYRSKREKYNAVIDEIGDLTEAGRPVLVGTTSVETSELLSKMLKLRGIQHNVLNAKLHQREAEVVAEAGHSSKVTIATNMAGRGTDIKLSEEVVTAGGLAIVGTERHEARRVDRQLRGRSGRQGDPGTTQFFVSLEDDLMRLFGSDRIAKIMDRLGAEEGEVIQHSMITKSIERAQRKIEQNNFGIRKRLLEYDDVMNSQREVIYKKRRHALFGERMKVDLNNTFYDACVDLIEQLQDHGTVEDFKLELLRIFAIESVITQDDLANLKFDELVEKLYQSVANYYIQKSSFIAEKAYPVIKSVYENKGNVVEHIVVPFTDGVKMLQVPVDLKKAYESQGKEVVIEFEKTMTLALIDDAWKEHLREMDDLKQSVQSAVYEQKDPLLIYKFEAFNLFKSMMANTNRELTSFLFKSEIATQNPDNIREDNPNHRTDLSQTSTSKPEIAASQSQPQNGQQQEQPQKSEPVRVEKKVGRNEPCPCGSGKKYKNCHGR